MSPLDPRHRLSLAIVTATMNTARTGRTVARMGARATRVTLKRHERASVTAKTSGSRRERKTAT